MGNYESYSPEFTAETYILPDETDAQALERISLVVDRAAFTDLSEAAQITNIKDSFILTWLHNRK